MIKLYRTGRSEKSVLFTDALKAQHSSYFFSVCTSSTLMNRSRPWFSIKWRQVVGDSSVRFQSALSVNLRVASTIP